MSVESSEAKQLLQNIWQVQGETLPETDEDCSPTKACKNVKDMNFDGFADEGMDLRSAWRERLAREGKLATGSGTIRDLVLGSSESN
jgi:hypothetical protein